MPISNRKRFGQHFLSDANVLNQIVDVINPKRDQHIVEIGPGLGVLTRELLPTVCFLDAIELDHQLIPTLISTFSDSTNFKLHQADAVNFNYTALEHATGKMRVVGNLPYNISTALIFRLIEFNKLIEDMHFMLQKEVVDRLLAPPGSRTYGRLSVFCQYYYELEHTFNVSAQSFSPPPKVESAFIRLVPRIIKSVNIYNSADFKNIVLAAFAMRRKTLRNCLKKLLTEQQIKDAGVDPSIRAEMLNLAQFASLSNILSQSQCP